MAACWQPTGLMERVGTGWWLYVCDVLERVWGVLERV